LEEDTTISVGQQPSAALSLTWTDSPAGASLVVLGRILAATRMFCSTVVVFRTVDVFKAETSLTIDALLVFEAEDEVR
jgi:hypothetical protein